MARWLIDEPFGGRLLLTPLGNGYVKVSAERDPTLTATFSWHGEHAGGWGFTSARVEILTALAGEWERLSGAVPGPLAARLAEVRAVRTGPGRG